MTDTKDEQGARRRPRPASPRANSTRKAARSSRASSADEARKLALIVASAALEKKAMAVEILDVVGKVDYADFLVLMTGRSNRHVDSLAQAIEEACAKKKRRALSTEGTSNAA
jgi:ribosome-associated protein